MAKAVADDYLRRIPKAELHCHLAGTLRATTVAELAKQYGIALPRPAETLYQWPELRRVPGDPAHRRRGLAHPADFTRAVYEYIEDAVRDGNLKHVEFFFNPDYFYPNGIDYPSQVAGMVEGLRQAEGALRRDRPAHLLHRPLAQQRRPGGRDRRDGARAPPRARGGYRARWQRKCRPSCLFAEAYALAKKGGLKCTAHCCEDYPTPPQAPPTNYLICRDVLRCDRIDHGYNMLASDFVMAEARRDGLYFTPCAWTSLLHNRPHRPQRIRRMAEAGLNVTINTDDPAMFGTNLGHGFTTLFESVGWGPDMARKFSLNSVEGSWLDESEQGRPPDGLPQGDRRPRQGVRLRDGRAARIAGASLVESGGYSAATPRPMGQETPVPPRPQ